MVAVPGFVRSIQVFCRCTLSDFGVDTSSKAGNRLQREILVTILAKGTNLGHVGVYIGRPKF